MSCVANPPPLENRWMRTRVWEPAGSDSIAERAGESSLWRVLVGVVMNHSKTE